MSSRYWWFSETLHDHFVCILCFLPVDENKNSCLHIVNPWRSYVDYAQRDISWPWEHDLCHSVSLRWPSGLSWIFDISGVYFLHKFKHVWHCSNNFHRLAREFCDEAGLDLSDRLECVSCNAYTFIFLLLNAGFMANIFVHGMILNFSFLMLCRFNVFCKILDLQLQLLDQLLEMFIWVSTCTMFCAILLAKLKTSKKIWLLHFRSLFGIDENSMQ